MYKMTTTACNSQFLSLSHSTFSKRNIFRGTSKKLIAVSLNIPNKKDATK